MTTLTDTEAALAGTLDMLRTALAVAGLRGDRGTADRVATLIADHTDPTPDVCVDLRCDGIRRAAAYLTSCGDTPAGWSFTADAQDHSAPADRADLEAAMTNPDIETTDGALLCNDTTCRGHDTATEPSCDLAAHTEGSA